MTHNRQEAILQFFKFDHLPEHLQAVSRPFSVIAQHMVDTLQPCAERTAGLRKLLEAKDCAVRAWLYKPVAEVVAGAVGEAGNTPLTAANPGADPTNSR
jgi:hypothetical protein